MNLEFSDITKKNDHKYLTVEDAIVHLFGEVGLNEIKEKVDFSKSIKLPTSVRSILKPNIKVDGKLKKDPIFFYKTILEVINSKNIEVLKTSTKKAPLKWQLDILSYYKWSKVEFVHYFPDHLKSIKRKEYKLLIEEMEDVIFNHPSLLSKLKEQEAKLKEKHSQAKAQPRKKGGKTYLSFKSDVDCALSKFPKEKLKLPATRLAYDSKILNALNPNKTVSDLEKGGKEKYFKEYHVTLGTVVGWIRKYKKENLKQ